jgi:CheY-like chemotaxis protein
MNASGHAETKPTTIFVVDDEPLLLELAALTLEPLGYEVRTFCNPELALREFAVSRPDLVITDYAMGRMSGMDLIRECRRLNPAQKVILISGTVDEQVFADARVRPDRFIGKPYQLSDFSSCIIEVLAQK